MMMNAGSSTSSTGAVVVAELRAGIYFVMNLESMYAYMKYKLNSYFR